MRAALTQFSLRGLLLIVTTAAVLMAVVYYQYPRRCSSFPHAFAPHEILLASCQQLGFKPLWSNYCGSGGGVSYPDYDWEVAVAVPANMTGAVFSRFEQNVRDNIERSNCRIRGYEGDNSFRFKYTYTFGSRVGTVHAYGYEDAERLRISVVVHEYQQR